MPKSNYYTLEDVSESNVYRECNLLNERELIDVERGRYNRILLTKDDKRTLVKFIEFSENYESLPLAVSEFEKKQLESQLQTVRKDKNKLKSENKTLRNQLVLVRKPIHKRILVRVRDFIDRWI